MVKDLMGLTEAVTEATGRAVHPNTVNRWARIGIGGIRLQTWKFGGRRLTTVEAVNNFVAAISATDASQVPR